MTVDVSWLVMFVVIVVNTENAFSQLYPGRPEYFYWTIGIVFSALVFLSVLMHELAQLAVAGRLGVKIKHIRLHLFGRIAPGMPEAGAGRHEFMIVLSGWIANIAIGFISLAIAVYFWLVQMETPVRGIAEYLAIANFILAAIHMIPGFPLDCGRILRAILWDRWNDVDRATRVVSQIGNGLGLFFIIFGILQFLLTQSFAAALLFVVGLIMKLSSVGSFKSVVQQHSLENVLVRQVMHDDFKTVDWLVSVEELVQEFVYKFRLTDIPVRNRDEIIGIVSLDRIKTVSKDLWTFKQVRDIMVPIEDVESVGLDSDASDVLKKMESGKITCMPVMENGQLAGIINRNDIVKFLQIKSELGPHN
ncbi:MAG: CBS domain-containing protein [Acidobacteriota bacterium]